MTANRGHEFMVNAKPPGRNQQSSGGLIVLELFMNGWTAETCLTKYTSLANQALKLPSSTLGKLMHGTLIVLTTDGRYGPTNIETAL